MLVAGGVLAGRNGLGATENRPARTQATTSPAPAGGRCPPYGCAAWIHGVVTTGTCSPSRALSMVAPGIRKLPLVTRGAMVVSGRTRYADLGYAFDHPGYVSE